MRGLRKYKRLIWDLRKTADMARSRPWDPFMAELCNRKMKEAATEYEKLIRYLENREVVEEKNGGWIR